MDRSQCVAHVTFHNDISDRAPDQDELVPLPSLPHNRCALCGRADAMSAPDPYAEFGGTDPKIVERRLLRKVDIRMLILIPIYIPNYVSCIL